MYENGIDVVYEARQGDDWGPRAKVKLPGWCAGDPQMGVALYLHGHRDDVDDVLVSDWQPHEDVLDGTEAAGAWDDDDPHADETIAERAYYESADRKFGYTS